MHINFNKQTPEYIREFTYYAERELGLDKLRGDIEFRYVYGELDESCFGLCWGDNREAEVHIAAKQWGKPITRENKLKSVAHELTHARQYLKRELIAKDELADGPMAKWCGKDMPYEYATEQNEPWEVEARLMEEKIYLKWENKRYK